MRGCDGIVVEVGAEDDLLGVGTELVEEAGVEGRSCVAVGEEVGTECVAEGFGGTIQGVEYLLESIDVFLSLIVVRSKTFKEVGGKRSLLSLR